MPEGGTVSDRDIRRWLLSNGLLFAVAGGLAFGASQTAGGTRLALGVLAALFALFAVWSTGLTLGVRLVYRQTKGYPGPSSEPSDST